MLALGYVTSVAPDCKRAWVQTPVGAFFFAFWCVGPGYKSLADSEPAFESGLTLDIVFSVVRFPYQCEDTIRVQPVIWASNLWGAKMSSTRPASPR